MRQPPEPRSSPLPVAVGRHPLLLQLHGGGLECYIHMAPIQQGHGVGVEVYFWEEELPGGLISFL